MPPCSTVLIDMRGKADRHERTRTAMILIGYEAMDQVGLSLPGALGDY